LAYRGEVNTAHDDRNVVTRAGQKHREVTAGGACTDHADLHGDSWTNVAFMAANG
jgi:hypothetical protein